VGILVRSSNLKLQKVYLLGVRSSCFHHGIETEELRVRAINPGVEIINQIARCGGRGSIDTAGTELFVTLHHDGSNEPQ
jgi:hypothetical protein